MPCMIDVDIDPQEKGSFICVQERKARKEHKCHECKGKILKNEKYEHASIMWEAGLFEVNKTCSACMEIRKKFMRSYYYGNIWEELQECFLDELTIGDIDGLSINAIAKLEEQMEGAWEEYYFETEREGELYLDGI